MVLYVRIGRSYSTRCCRSKRRATKPSCGCFSSSPNSLNLLSRVSIGTRLTTSLASRKTSGAVFPFAQHHLRATGTNARINALGTNMDNLRNTARGAVVNVATKTIARKWAVAYAAKKLQLVRRRILQSALHRLRNEVQLRQI